jgi:hypothetical protein
MYNLGWYTNMLRCLRRLLCVTGTNGEWVALKEEQSIGTYSTKNIRGKKGYNGNLNMTRWGEGRGGEGRGAGVLKCLLDITTNIRPHQSQSVAQGWWGTSTLHLLLSQVPILSGFYLTHALTLQLYMISTWGMRTWKIHTLQDSICFEFLTFP